VTGPHVLSASLRVLRAEAAGLLGEPPPAEALDAVLAEFADGYAEGLRKRTRSEQESLIEAVLKTRDEAEAALRASEERFRTVFTQAGVGIGIAALNAEITEVNPALVAMFGSKGLLIEPCPITDQAHPEDAPAFSQLFGELTRGERESFRSETRFVRPDSTVLWTHLTASLVRDEHGEPAYVVCVVEDVTERHQLRTRLRHQTYHDQLTRLPNRSLMDEQLYLAFSEGSPVARVGLCHLDLDGFRRINDSLGHQVGDQLLLAVAGRLHLSAGQHLITRTGGDEFAILVTDPPDTGFLCALADKVLAGLAPPFVIGSQRLSITASMGIAEDAVANTWAGELQRAADAARTWAKDAGGGRWAVFDAERDAGETSRFALAASVPGAVDRDEFDVFYQPLVDLGSGGLVGVEALVRWRHPEHGLLGPARFIDLAERNGAIVPLGRWVLEAACRQARSWADELGGGAPYVSVNVAPRQLAEPGWLAEVSSVLAETGLDPGQLQLEITERAVLVDEPAASGTLRALRDMGVRLAVDDFGTGYSSLSYLRRLPVHGLKIDGSFIRGLRGPLVCDTGPVAAESAESADGKIVEALISMAHALNLVVTAEWVETAEQAHRLVALGCDVGQGHWYGDPMPARQLDPLLRRPLAG
jgi:diguanylate cyclase (GGDEF)-like protein/PAS domain S-box-containing protein